MDQQRVIVSVFEAFVDDDDVHEARDRLALIEDANFAHFIGLVLLYHMQTGRSLGCLILQQAEKGVGSAESEWEVDAEASLFGIAN